MTGANNRHMLLREEHARSEAEDSLALSLRYAMRLEGRRETQDMDGLRQSKDIPSSLDVAATARNAPPIWPSESIPFHNSEEKPSPLFTRECLGSCSALSARTFAKRKYRHCRRREKEAYSCRCWNGGREGMAGGSAGRKKGGRKEEKRGRALSCCNANVFMVDIGTRKPCSDMRGRLVSERIHSVWFISNTVEFRLVFFSVLLM